MLPGVEPQVSFLAAKALGIFHSEILCNLLIGHLSTSPSTLTTEFVEFEVKRALEWLQGKYS